MNERYSRQSFLGRESEMIFKELRVGVPGIGGGGSHTVLQLAHVGIHWMAVSDPDVVEISNLNRMVGATLRDANEATPKVEVAERVIKAVNPAAYVLPIQRKWQLALAELRECNVLVGCLDSFRERDELERFARQSLIPYIDIGMDVFEYEEGYAISGQVALSLPGQACLRCMGIVTDQRIAEESRKYGAAGGRPQVVWANGTLASVAVGLLIQLVAPWHSDAAPSALLEYNGNTHTIQPSNRLLPLVGKDCPHHPLNEVGDRFWS